MDKIVHYSKSDLLYGHNLNECARFIDNYSEHQTINNFNDLFLLFNIEKYLEDEVTLDNWSEGQITKYKEFGKGIKAQIGSYLGNLDIEKLPSYYDETDRRYRRDFFVMLAIFGIHKKIDEDVLTIILNKSKSWKNELLVSPQFVHTFDTLICEALCADIKTAEVILNQYEVKNITKTHKLHFPASFNHIKREKVIKEYIDSSEANLNYIRLISDIQSNKDRVLLSKKTIKRARDRAIALEEELFEEGQGIRNHMTVSFSEELKTERDVKINGMDIHADYSKKWIKDNLDYPTLLNNFIYLFEYVDLQMQCTLINLKSSLGVLERFMGVKSQFSYDVGVSFRYTNQLALMQMNGYYNELLNHDIRIEEVIEWFFTEYLKTEFGIDQYHVSMPSKGSTMLEKCSNIMPAFESVLKQFCLYIEEGEIDHDLLEIKTEHLFIESVPSLIDKKYYYLEGDDSEVICNLLFSDQTAFGYLERIENQYDNLFELILNEKIVLDDFKDFGIEEIKWLVEQEVVHENRSGNIDFVDLRVVLRFKELYYNEVISYWHYPNEDRLIIDELYKKGLVRYESTLFSIPEYEYFDYYLNRARFNNGLDLRNRYSHGQVISIKNAKIHNYNYMQFLKLFVIAVIKINDEFCLRDDHGYNKEVE